jgi:hypothetical protein
MRDRGWWHYLLMCQEGCCKFVCVQSWVISSGVNTLSVWDLASVNKCVGMPALVTARVRITVKAHDVLQLLDATVVFHRVCCTNPLTLMHVCPDNAVQMPKDVAVLEKICSIDGDQALLYKCPVETRQVPRRCCIDSETFVSFWPDAKCGGVRRLCTDTPAMLINCPEHAALLPRPYCSSARHC